MRSRPSPSSRAGPSQEEGEAVGKWRRARLTSAQLTTYFYGFSQMMKMRRM